MSAWVRARRFSPAGSWRVGRLPWSGIALGQAARDGVFGSPNGDTALLLRLAQAHAHDGLRKRSAGSGAMDWSGVGHWFWRRTVHKGTALTSHNHSGKRANRVITLNLAP